MRPNSTRPAGPMHFAIPLEHPRPVATNPQAGYGTDNGLTTPLGRRIRPGRVNTTLRTGTDSGLTRPPR